MPPPPHSAPPDDGQENAGLSPDGRSRTRRRWRTVRESVRGHSANEARPLKGYLALAGGYAATAAVALAASARTGTTGQPLSAADLARITVATHRISRTLTKEAVTAPLRAPFTRYVEPGMAAEVHEEVAPSVTGHPYQHAVGELLTCPFCMSQWAATALVAGHLLAPRQSRIVTSVLTAVAGADALHYLYSALDRLERP